MSNSWDSNGAHLSSGGEINTVSGVNHHLLSLSVGRTLRIRGLAPRRRVMAPRRRQQQGGGSADSARREAASVFQRMDPMKRQWDTSYGPFSPPLGWSELLESVCGADSPGLTYKFNFDLFLCFRQNRTFCQQRGTQHPSPVTLHARRLLTESEFA